MTSLLTKIITWGLSYIANALSFFYIGKQHEENKNQAKQLEAINEASTLRANLKRDTAKRDKLRKLYKR